MAEAQTMICSTRLDTGSAVPSQREGAKDEARRSIDALVNASLRYSSSKDYLELLTFIRRFHWYAPLNALLVHVQRPGARYVAPATRWLEQHRRQVLPEAQALIILQPFGPVMFVYDVGQTRALDGAPPLPPEAADPFCVRGAASSAEVTTVLERTVTNARRDGVRLVEAQHGSQSAGWIAPGGGGSQLFQVKARPEPVHAQVPVRYHLSINPSQNGRTRYATLAHELAHLYCGHLGTPDQKWWPSRTHVDHVTAEFEAESVAAMVLQRLDPTAVLPSYLHQYLRHEPTVPSGISLERVTAAAELILTMGKTQRLELRIPGRRKNERSALT